MTGTASREAPISGRVIPLEDEHDGPVFEELFTQLLDAWRRKQELRDADAAYPDLVRAWTEFDDARERMREYHHARRTHPTRAALGFRHALGG